MNALQVLNDELSHDAALITAEALHTITRNYGDGFTQEGVIATLPYHGLIHTGNAIEDNDILMGAMGLQRAARATGRAAMASHDVIQCDERGIMEAKSAAWLEAQMRKREIFSDKHIQMGRLAIIGTEPIIEKGIIVGQMVDRQSYDSCEAELVARSIASADFGRIYAPEGPLLSLLWYKETKGLGYADRPPLDGFVDFQAGQIALVANYRYPHELGERIFGRLRREVVAHHESVLRKLVSGTVENWDELVAVHADFMRQHGGRGLTEV